jgi:hypothetical protein
MRMPFAVVGVVLLPTIALSDGTAARSCVDALEQLAALHMEAPVYKLVGGERRFLDDADRPAQIARLEKIIGASCSADPKVRLSLGNRGQAPAHSAFPGVRNRTGHAIRYGAAKFPRASG